MREKIFTGILLLVLYVGLSLLLYPTVADWWNSMNQTKVINDYTSQVEGMNDQAYEEELQKAYDYNATLLHKDNYWRLSEEEEKVYNNLLDVTDNGIMAYVEIPQIGVKLPIYHGTESVILQTAIGHIEYTSLPVGGESTHMVISGHRGLPSARLFTDLDQLVVGDRFQIHVLKELLTYEIDQILTVLPDEMDSLAIEEGQDYCTLVTCTPYGVNDHRLLVRGHRVENTDIQVRITSDVERVDEFVVAIAFMIPLFLILFIIEKIIKRVKKSRRKKRANSISRHKASQKHD